MKPRFLPIFVAPLLLLSACDLRPRVLDALSGGAPITGESSNDNQEIVNDPSPRDDYLLAESSNDYFMPAQDARETGGVKREAQDDRPVAQSEPDDVLLVPARVAGARARVDVLPPPSDGLVVVERGDTLFSISQKYGLPVRDVADANKIAAPYALSVGQKLKLPGARYHTVAAGETLYSISRAHSVDLNSLARENNLSEPYGLYQGQRLRLPASITLSPHPSPLAATPAPQGGQESPKAPANTYGAVPGSARTTPAVVIPPKPKISSTTASGDLKKLPATAARASTKFSQPVAGKIISDFGAKKNGLYNDGINIAAKQGAAVRAAENGVVAYAGNELKGMGNLIIIQHDGGWMTVYAHLDSILLRRGAKVAVGDQIGTVGATGKVSEPQLHFEIRNGTRAYNPNTMLKK